MITHAASRQPLSIALVLWIGVLFLVTQTTLDDRMEMPLLDANLRYVAAQSPADPDIVVLDIGEPSLEAMAPEYGRYPWTRAVYGTLIEGLARQKPAAIVFDILFTDPHRDYVQDDLYFIRAARNTPNVFFPMVRLPGKDEEGIRLADVKAAEPAPAANAQARAALLLPLPGLADTGRIGTINIDADADGAIRRYPLFQEIAGWRIPSLPARVANELEFELPRDESLGLIWHGPARTYRTVSFHEVLFDLERRHSQRSPEEFKNKIVIIGGSAPGLFDLKLTPMSTSYPGPEVIATALDNLKNGERLAMASPWVGVALSALLLVALAYAFTRGWGPLPIGAGFTAVGAFVIGTSVFAMAQWRYALPATIPLLSGALCYVALALRAYLLERHHRQRVTQLFGRFLDPRVVAQLVEHGGADSAGVGEKRDVTVLFSDIRGFTTLSERHTPQHVVELLNRYFRIQVEIIFRHGGTLDKYIGDAIMAFWGAPGVQPDHAQRALAAARDMEQALLRFREELGEAGKHFDIGIGLNSGEVIVGFIGSPEHRQDYTVIGDAVNTASRIEGATKDRARILVSQRTRDALGGDIEFRDHGWVALKGKEEKVRLYEPLRESAAQRHTTEGAA